MKTNSDKSIKKIRLRYEEGFFKGVMFLSNYLIAFLLGLIIYTILKTGVPSLTWEMITETPKGGFYFGKEGGILNAIIGSLYLALGSTLLAFVIGLPVALYMNTWMIHKRNAVNAVRFVLDLLWGIPSIVYGAFGFTLMMVLGLKASLIAGILVVALLILPIMIRGIDEGLKTIPRGLQEASYSLGSTKSEMAFLVMMRQSLPCIITAILLSFGRAMGDAAAVLFTTGFTDNIPTSLLQPTATLPLAIFFQLSSPIPEVKARAYAAAVILTIIILIISLLSRFFTYRYAKHSIKF
ncbi:MAG TPA: phosphate ABC transporter permease PstA [Prolixibacteraceae bacterium]|nr:phosphate ABC transporter permease PstA [Prolixibacteraceae bacterium]